jgi:hypothetical protein
LFLKLDLDSLLAQFARSRINLESPESNRSPEARFLFHGKLLVLSAIIV